MANLTESFDSAQEQVSDLFGLVTTNLADLIIPDITGDLSSITDPDALRAALISGEVLAALSESTTDIGTALEVCVDFSGADGQLIVAEDLMMLISSVWKISLTGRGMS